MSDAAAAWWAGLSTAAKAGFIAGGTIVGAGAIATAVAVPLTRRSVQRDDLALAGVAGRPRIQCWAWNSAGNGGFMGYGIHAAAAQPGDPQSGGYTWVKGAAASAATCPPSGPKWHQQAAAPGTQAEQACKFWDFVSRAGSFAGTTGRQPLDGLKVQYETVTYNQRIDTPEDALPSPRFQQLVRGLLAEGLEVGLLVGGKPLNSGARYHGQDLREQCLMVEAAAQFVLDGLGGGGRAYVSIDCEPADAEIDHPDLSRVRQAYKVFFAALAGSIGRFRGKDVHFGFAFNKNVYNNAATYTEWVQHMLPLRWTAGGKPRGLRVLELMYWWTATDYLQTAQATGDGKEQAQSSHLYPALLAGPRQPDGTTRNVVVDALDYGLYLQFGMETTGDVDYLSYVPTATQPKEDCGDDKCSPTASQSPCFRVIDGVVVADADSQFRCHAGTKPGPPTPSGPGNPVVDQAVTLGEVLPSGSAGAATPAYELNCAAADGECPHVTDAYYGALQFQGSQKDFEAAYGYPFLKADPDDAPQTGCGCAYQGGDEHPGDVVSEAVWANTTKSCQFLALETWLLGGGLQYAAGANAGPATPLPPATVALPQAPDAVAACTCSLEEFLHDPARGYTYLSWVLTQVLAASGRAGADVRRAVYRVPFCLEDLTGYSGWLHNYYASKQGAPFDIEAADVGGVFPDRADGSVCVTARAAREAGKPLRVTGWPDKTGKASTYDVAGETLPCLGWSVGQIDGAGLPAKALHAAGTLKYTSPPQQQDSNPQYECDLSYFYGGP